MWQSALRIVFALLITAVGASLMIGSVSAEGPVSKEPPGEAAVPPGQLYTRDNPLILPVRYEAGPLFQKQVEVLNADGTMAYTQSGSTCRTVVHIASHQGKTLRASTKWCWFNDRYEIDGEPKLGVSANYSSDWRVASKRHRKTRGGDGSDRVYTNAYGRFCHNNVPNTCAAAVIEIDARHFPTGVYGADAKYYNP